jgi:nicotinamidase-related amidase
MLVAPGSAGSGLIAGIAGSGSADEGPTAVDADLLLNQGVQQLGENEIVLFKPRWGAFYRTGLQTWLAERGVDTVVLAGCNLPNCPRVTLFEASERDFRTVLALDAVSGASPERLGDLAAIGVNLLPSTAIVQRLQDVRVEV